MVSVEIQLTKSVVGSVYFVIMHATCCYVVKLRIYSVYFFGDGGGWWGEWSSLKYRVTHGNLTCFEWVVLGRYAARGNEVVGILFLLVGHFNGNGDLAC